MNADFKVDTQIQLPQFLSQLSIPLVSLNSGSVAWGDYDNDGHLDILITGVNSSITGDWSIYTMLYRNNGNNTFSEQTSISITGVRGGSAVWGDYNNDGYLDILLTGTDASGMPVSKIYRNNENNTFTEQTSISLSDVNGGAVWGDYDNDGHLDILSPNGKIYRNNGDNTFTEQTTISLTDITGGAVWGDYDNDGYLDILSTNGKIYHNNGNNTFTELTSVSLTSVNDGSVAWGDYDNDGYLDILLTGETTSGTKVSKIYHNNGNNTFTEETSIPLTGVRYSSATWGDYDNDGYLDILLTGFISLQKGSISKIYHNNGNNAFTEQTSIHLFGLESGSAAWGDYDNDGDLDILLSGIWGNEDLAIIYQNNNSFPNTLPSIPTNLRQW